MSKKIELIALPNFPLVEPGDCIASLICTSLEKENIALQDNDIIVIAQKVVSKSENRYRNLQDITASAEAIELAKKTDKDPRLVQAILDESKKIVRYKPGVIIVEHRLGFIHANAGIDQSNIESSTDNERILLLPKDPDASAANIQKLLTALTNTKPGIVISDSFGRSWRVGTSGVAIGVNKTPALLDLRGEEDLFGREMKVTQVGIADEIAAAASLLMGQSAEACPVVLIRGLSLPTSNNGITPIIREEKDDLFR